MANCDIYDNSQKCIYCKEDHFLNSGLCEAVLDTIDNCLYYSSSGDSCEVCKEGSFLYIDKKYCIFLENFDGCAFWSQLHCSSCVENYFFSPNAYISEYFKKAVNIQQMYEYVALAEKKNVYSFVPKNCVATAF